MVVLSPVMSLMVKGLRCATHVVARMGAVQGTLCLRAQLQLDLAAAGPDAVEVLNAGELMRIRKPLPGGGEQTVSYYQNERKEVFSKVHGEKPSRIGRNLAAELTEQLTDGRLQVSVDGTCPMNETPGTDRIAIPRQARGYALSTSNRFAGRYNSVPPPPLAQAAEAPVAITL